MRYNKLVRDGVIKILKNKGLENSYHNATGEEISKKLDEKLIEEVYEFLENKSEEELSDIEEVINTMRNFYHLDKNKIDLLREKKFRERGGFEKKIILEEVKENYSKTNNCFFCNVYDEGKEVEYESNHFYSRFDRFPINPGHIGIISKRHTFSFNELNFGEWLSLQNVIKDTIEIIESSNLEDKYLEFLRNPVNDSSKEFLKNALESPFIHARPESYNHGINDGIAAGRTINHFHLHIIPRYMGDVENPRGGVRHIIPGKGSY